MYTSENPDAELAVVPNIAVWAHMPSGADSPVLGRPAINKLMRGRVVAVVDRISSDGLDAAAINKWAYSTLRAFSIDRAFRGRFPGEAQCSHVHGDQQACVKGARITGVRDTGTIKIHETQDCSHEQGGGCPRFFAVVILKLIINTQN